MKNSIVFKFLAVLLCAASLLGILGGAAGALVLAEGNLYNQTVDEMLDEKFRSDSELFAEQTALAYASRELGGCSEDMIQRYGFQPNFRHGYAILDAEGNVLESLNPELKEIGKTEVYTIPVSGQYMHLVSLETESQKRARETAARMEAIGQSITDSDGETVPEGGIIINEVIFTNKEGAPIYEAYGDRHSSHSIFYYGDDGNVRGDSSYDHGPQNQIGFLYYGVEGQLMYRSFLEEGEYDFEPTDIYSVLFLSHDPSFVFQTDSRESLGVLRFENGHLYFTGHPLPDASAEETQPEETVPATTEKATPETTEKSAPETTEKTAPKASKKTVSKNTDKTVSETTVSETKAKGNAEGTQPEETKARKEASSASAVPEVSAPEETAADATQPILINDKPLEFYQVNKYEFYDTAEEEHTTARYVYLALPELTVEVYADRDTVAYAEAYNVLRLVRYYRNYLLPAIGICLLIFAITAVYLCTAAGRKPKTDAVRAGGLNRMPLDLYLSLAIFSGMGIAALAIYLVPELLERDVLLSCCAAAAAAFTVCLLLVAFLFAFVAQCKTPGGFWWRNLLCLRLVFLCMRFLMWLERWLREQFFPWLGWLLKTIWRLIWKVLVRLYEAVETATSRTGRMLNRWFSLLPVTWQWITTGMLLFCLLLIACNTYNEFLTLVCLAASLALIFYGARCFGLLLESTRKMGRGELNTKVDDRRMIGCFREFAGDLNEVADVAMEAAQKQLKSERMKTELITNVSHDIKTPLTSIINYVDLLHKPHTEDEAIQYLEVLNRQSQRLKKLVEDLMDMSKASTGNMTVEITTVDAVESVNQALGEFSDKLDRARLYPVFRHTDVSVPMLADGKLVWRVLSNLLGNAVKYAMPGTRVYLDLTRVDGKVVISLKNISRDELNVDADELMERFVRGDVSRNTEGSGLGLNIAKSLMELQKGQLQLLVDGDLFKVTLIFPAAE